MKYIWMGINTALIFLLFAYVFITKDINTKAYDKAVELEQRMNINDKRDDLQDKIIEAMPTQKKDTFVINMIWFNEKYYKKHYPIK